jgi:hypothetical protein
MILKIQVIVMANHWHYTMVADISGSGVADGAVFAVLGRGPFDGADIPSFWKLISALACRDLWSDGELLGLYISN